MTSSRRKNLESTWLVLRVWVRGNLRLYRITEGTRERGLMKPPFLRSRVCEFSFGPRGGLTQTNKVRSEEEAPYGQGWLDTTTVTWTPVHGVACLRAWPNVTLYALLCLLSTVYAREDILYECTMGVSCIILRRCISEALEKLSFCEAFREGLAATPDTWDSDPWTVLPCQAHTSMSFTMKLFGLEWGVIFIIKAVPSLLYLKIISMQVLFRDTRSSSRWEVTTWSTFLPLMELEFFNLHWCAHALNIPYIRSYYIWPFLVHTGVPAKLLGIEFGSIMHLKFLTSHHFFQKNFRDICTSPRSIQTCYINYQSTRWLIK